MTRHQAKFLNKAERIALDDLFRIDEGSEPAEIATAFAALLSGFYPLLFTADTLEEQRDRLIDALRICLARYQQEPYGTPEAFRAQHGLYPEDLQLILTEKAPHDAGTTDPATG